MTRSTSTEAAEAWIPTDRSFGARLALVRQSRGWGNVKQASLICGIAPESWRSWERDDKMPRGSSYFETCERIAAASGCDYGWLVDRRPTGDSQVTDQRLRPRLATYNPEVHRTPREQGKLRLCAAPIAIA